MKILLLLFPLFIIRCPVFSQNKNESPKFNVVSFQIGKQGILFNVNYDHKFQNKNWGYKLETSANLFKGFQLNTFSIGSYILKGNSIKNLELGFDINYLYTWTSQDDVKGANVTFFPEENFNTLYPNLNIGYRKYYQKGMFRVGFAPGYFRDRFLYDGYISIGIKL